MCGHMKKYGGLEPKLAQNLIAKLKYSEARGKKTVSIAEKNDQSTLHIPTERERRLSIVTFVVEKERRRSDVRFRDGIMQLLQRKSEMNTLREEEDVTVVNPQTSNVSSNHSEKKTYARRFSVAQERSLREALTGEKRKAKGDWIREPSWTPSHYATKAKEKRVIQHNCSFHTSVSKSNRINETEVRASRLRRATVHTVEELISRMDERRKSNQNDAKNPAVWRKTGQPDPNKKLLEKHDMTTAKGTGGVKSMDDKSPDRYDKLADQHAGKQRVTSISKNRYDTYVMEGDKARGPSKQTGGQNIDNNFPPSPRGQKKQSDPLGLGFQGPANKNFNLATNSDSYSRTKSILPPIKDGVDSGRGTTTSTSTRPEADTDDSDQAGTKLTKLTKLKRGYIESGTVELPKISADEKFITGNDGTSSSISKWNGSSEKTAKGKSPTFLPFQLTSAKGDSKRFGSNELYPDNSDKSSTNFIDGLPLPSTDKTERKHSTFETPSKTNSKKRMGHYSTDIPRNFSTSGRASEASISHDVLIREAYGMSKLNFTKNFTFSYEEIPAHYRDFNATVKGGIHDIGKRRRYKAPPKRTTVKS